MQTNQLLLYRSSLQAVCCKDHLHCCPNGTVCNLATSMCDHPSGPALIPLLPITPAFHLLAENSKCDESTSCPGEATCCKTASGEWACCPLLEAVCCDDHIHCCPHGMVCNLEAETCDDSSGVLLPLPLLTKVPALTSRARHEKVMCDTQTSCPKDTTCCFMERTHKWGCCPLPEAVCCTDHEHCCPQGYTCNMQTATCEKKGYDLQLAVPLLSKVEQSELREAEDTNVPCDSTGLFHCPKTFTCCKISATEWSCCPSAMVCSLCLSVLH
ncbi:hypothetical protein GOODEAATRI_022090 [Goodea atripinnis]|uniref:Granulins domain-containing protein n=1 Tax=Goodea atripinnis TaxID=208336 RepID=A0ABV0MU62_9TELE